MDIFAVKYLSLINFIHAYQCFEDFVIVIVIVLNQTGLNCSDPWYLKVDRELVGYGKIPCLAKCQNEPSQIYPPFSISVKPRPQPRRKLITPRARQKIKLHSL